MNSISWQVAGWTMIHFLWIGSLVFLMTAVVRLALFRAAPSWRYAASLLGLAVLAVSPPLIAWELARDVKPIPVAVEPVAIAAVDRYETPIIAPTSVPEVPTPAVIDLKYTPITVEARSVEAPLEAAPIETIVEAAPAAVPTAETAETSFDPQWLLQTLPSYLPWLWMIGTPATLLLLATGLMGSERLRRRAEPITDPVLVDTLARLATALRLGRKVSIAVSDRVLQPVLVGIVRPLVLLPSVALTSWSAAEIEMALVHELAHVRRWDNLVNLVQRLIESLLFFHPAVWITSRWVRADREHCCDAVVVAHCGNREAYASLLVSVAKQSIIRRLPSPAMALASHPLARRVRRILQLEDDPMLVSKRTLLSVAVLLAALTAGAVWSSTLAEETKGEPEASATGVEGDASEDRYGTTESTEDAEKEGSIVLHPDLTETELADIRKKLKEANSGYSISVDRPFVFLRSNDGVVKARAVEIKQGSWCVVAPTLSDDFDEVEPFLMAEFRGFEIEFVNQSIKTAVKEMKDFAIEVVRSDSGPIRLLATRKNVAKFFTDFEGPTRIYHIDEAIPAETIKMLIVAHEKAGNSVAIRQGDGKNYQVVVTKPGAASDNPGEPEVSAPGAKETKDWKDNERDADTDNSLTPDLDFVGTSKTYIWHPGIPKESLVELIEKHSQAGHQMVTASSNGRLQLIVTRGDKPTSDNSIVNDLPFLSLEDQRIADLAYGMLGVEVAAINAEELAAVKEKGFAGGVRLDEIPGYGGMSSSPAAGADLTPGDILVGLHVWPTADLDQLAEVLRRSDLNQFTPLKYYVLRQGIRTEYLDGSAPHLPPTPNKVPSGQWSLHTGRVSFDNDKWRVEQQRLKQIELKAERDAGTTTLLPLPGQPGAVKVEATENKDVAEPKVAPPATTTPIAEAPNAEPIKPAPPQLLYDGRTFDDWRTEWKTELKTEKRTEAIKALRAFGRAGYGKEATEAILEVAEEYPMTSIGDTRSPAAALQTAIAYSFADINDSSPIPSDIALPVILDWYDKGEANRVRLAQWVLAASFSKEKPVLERVYALGEKPEMARAVLQHLMRSDPPMENDLTRQALKRLLESKDAKLIASTISQLLPTSMVGGGGGGFVPKIRLKNLPVNLPSLLFHKDPRVRQYARWAVKHASPEQLENLPELLMGIVEQPGEAASFGDVTVVEKTDNAKDQKSRRLDALRALAAIGPNAESMSERLVAMFETGDDDTKQFAELSLGYIYPPRDVGGGGGGSGGSGGIPAVLYERMEKSMEGRPKVESKFDWNKESVELFPPDLNSGGFGGDQGGGGMF